MGGNLKKVKYFFQNNLQKICKKQKTPDFRDFYKIQVFKKILIFILKTIKKSTITIRF